jgi:hypothetical protein
MSGTPSPLMSATASAVGALPTGVSTLAWNVPSRLHGIDATVRGFVDYLHELA